jgi:hypothetical protein
MKSIFCFLFFTISCFVEAQPPSKFYTRIGGNGYDVGYDVKQTLDNGYIITGSTSSMGVGNTDMYLLKLDSMGQIKFQTTFGNANNDIGKSVIQLIDSSYIMVGYTNSIGFGGYDIFLVKADKYGALVWQKTIGGTDWDFANSLQQTSDGGFIIAGSTYSYGYGNEDGYVVKTDANGNITWSKTFGGANDDEFKSVIQTADGGYALCGSTKSYGDINGDAWVFKLLANGDSAWSKIYGGVKEDFANKIIQVQSSDIVVAGGTKSSSVGGNSETNFTTFNVINGNQTYSYTNLTSVDEYYNGIAQGINGLIVACGSTHSIFYSFDGAINMYTSYYSYFNAFSPGGSGQDELFAISKTKDKGYVVVGKTNSYGAILDDVFFIKMDSVGNYGNSITSLKNIELNNLDVTIFPNPSTDIINTVLPNDFKINKSYYKITDINGHEVLSNNIHYHHSKIDISDLSAGLYFFQLYNEIGLLKTSKISVIK